MGPKDDFNYVSQSVRRLKKRLNKGLENDGKDEIRKETIREATDMGIEDFLTRLKNGEIEIKSVADFERLAKISLLLSGDPTERIGTTNEIDEDETVEETVLLGVMDDPAMDAIRKRLAKEMNKRNEENGLSDL